MKESVAIAKALDQAREQGLLTEGLRVKPPSVSQSGNTGGMSEKVVLMMPWPPSVNNLFATVGAMRVLSKVGRSYRESVAAIVRNAGSPRFGTSGLAVSIEAFPPDRRARDLDNLLKAPLDALQHAGVFNDDSQVQRITIERGKRVNGGLLRVEVAGLTRMGGSAP